MYIYTYSSHYRESGLVKAIKFGTAVNATCQGHVSMCHGFASPALLGAHFPVQDDRGHFL